MKSNGKVLISSLSAGFCALMLLGFSGIALSDPQDGPYCFVGRACGLGVYAHKWYHVVPDNYVIPDDIYEDLGVCGYDTESPPQCACNGWAGGGIYYVIDMAFNVLDFMEIPAAYVSQVYHPECWNN
jgi:hypothetical protein